MAVIKNGHICLQKNRYEPNCLSIFDHFVRRVAGVYFEESKFILYFLVIFLTKYTVM
jgi:hypothetical protein